MVVMICDYRTKSDAVRFANRRGRGKYFYLIITNSIIRVYNVLAYYSTVLTCVCLLTKSTQCDWLTLG